MRVASSAGGGVVFRAGDYAGDTLGWSEFDVDSSSPMPSFPLPPPAPVKLATTPTPVRFGGMPSPRYWEFEDARFNFGNVDAAGHDLGRLLLLQFAALFGNDWFLVPVALDAGTVTLLDHVVVTDVFGRHFAISRGADPHWSLFGHEAVPTRDRRPGSPPNHTPRAARCSCRRRSVRRSIASRWSSCTCCAMKWRTSRGASSVLRIAPRCPRRSTRDLACKPDD